MKISACMIVKNEERVIARCIESYRAFVDEIIVIDTGSTDQTLAIAESLGARVFHFTWIDDFAAAKNYGISQAKGDWIVFLDADEYFANGTGGNLRDYLKRLNKAFNCVACKMINIDEASRQIVSEITHVRLFKNDKQIRYVRPIHEMLYNFRKGEKMNAYLADKRDILIYHTGYSQDNQREKAQRNLALLLRQLNDPVVKPEYYYYIADAYFALDEWDKVIEYIRLFLNSGTELVGHNVRAHNILIDAMTQLDYHRNEIMREVDDAISKFLQHPLFYFYKGKLLYDDKRYDAAFAQLRQALQLHENYQDIEVNSLTVNLGTVYILMAAISEFRNDYGAAVEYYLKSLQLDKLDATSFDRLLKLIRNQPIQDIISFLNTIYDVDNEADLEFLAARLVNHATPKVLAYYTNLREKKYPKQDLIVLQMLIANRYYDKAFASLLDYYVQGRDEQLATVTTAAALLSWNEQYVAQCVETMPPSYVKIAKAYYSGDPHIPEDFTSTYLKLIRLFILWGDTAGLEHLVSLIDLFPDVMQAAAKAGSVFIKEGDYQNGLRLYRSALDRAIFTTGSLHPTLYYNQGYCLYRVNNHSAAVEAFIQAYRLGYRANDIFEFLRWSIRNEHDRDKAKAALGEDWRFVQSPQ